MTFADSPMSPTGEIFGTVRRFHIYDHDRDSWAFSGADFGERCIVHHEYDGADELTEFSSPETIVDGQSELTLVWEDGEDAEYEEAYVDMDAAGGAAQEVISHLADDLGVEPDRVKVVSVEAPNRVLYYLMPEPIRREPDE